LAVVGDARLFDFLPAMHVGMVERFFVLGKKKSGKKEE
jgi:hypothetical protein